MPISKFSWYLVLISLITGFAAGWFSKPTHETTQSKVGAIVADRPSPPTVPLPTRAVSHKEPSAERSVTRPAEVPLPKDPVLARLETIAWLKQNGILPYVVIFNSDSLHPLFARMFGLSPAETDQLSTAIKSAKRNLDDIAMKAATAKTAPDGSTVVVTVEGSSVEGGAVYAKLLNTFTNVLGPERYAQFSALAGETFERGFDRFGLNTVKYEITVEPAESNHPGPIYLIKSSHVDAEGNGSASGVSIFPAADAAKMFPVIARFLPPASGKPPGN
jgi:hypothetical protein